MASAPLAHPPMAGHRTPPGPDHKARMGPLVRAPQARHHRAAHAHTAPDPLGLAATVRQAPARAATVRAAKGPVAADPADSTPGAPVVPDRVDP
jgi:hypothetical protein